MLLGLARYPCHLLGLVQRAGSLNLYSFGQVSRQGIDMQYTHPWNILTLTAGIAILVAGSRYYDAPDWDIPISLIMAGFTYLTAAWSLQVILKRRWRMIPAMLLATWWAVDGCYALYWHFRNPMALELMRDANWPASLALYFACGVVWTMPEIWGKK